jgi:hypothetical protein
MYPVLVQFGTYYDSPLDVVNRLSCVVSSWPAVVNDQTVLLKVKELGTQVQWLARVRP